jgi:HEAT repeat protein
MPTSAGAGPFRGLAPFAEKDESLFFGRDTELSRLRTLLSEPKAQPILVTGELGAGKTSLIQAGLLPMAQKADYLTLYAEVGMDWEERLREDLARYVGRALEPGDVTGEMLVQVAQSRQKRLLIVFDQLEQLTWLSPHERKSLEQVIATLSETPLSRPVYCVNRGSLHVLGMVLGKKARIPDSHRVALGRFDVEQAASIIEQTVLAGGGYMEAGLPRVIAEDLTEDGGTTPAQLQRVCHAAVLERALTLKRYRRAGSATVLESLYVERLCAKVGGWNVLRALAVLAEAENPRARASAEEIAAGAGSSQEAVEKLLSELVDIGLVRRIEIRGRQSYSLLHSALQQSIRDLVAPVRRGRAKARLALRKRIDGGPLRPYELVTIKRYLGRSVTDRELTKIQRSQRLWVVIAILVMALPFLLYGGIFLRLRSNFYLSSAADQAGTPRVVVRSGDPALSFAFNWTAPGFGTLQLDTGIALSSLPPALAKRIESEEIVGPLLDNEAGLPVWLSRLLSELPEARRGALMMLAGKEREGVALLSKASQQPDSRRLATRLLVLLRGDSKEAREALLAAMTDKRPAVRAMAARSAVRLGDKTKLAVLEKAVRDADASVRLFAVHALSGAEPKPAIALWAKRLFDADVRVQKAALSKLEALATKHPARVVEAVSGALSSSKAGGDKLRAIVPQLEALQQKLVSSAPKRLARYLISALGRGSQSAQRQVAELRLLRSMAEHVDAKIALPLLSTLRRAKNESVQMEAIALWARFAEPDDAMNELRRLSRIYRPRKTGIAMRRAAATGLGLCRAEAKDRIKILKVLLNDPSGSVRRAAVGSMLSVGPGSLRDITARMRRGYVGIGRAALHAVCQSLTPKRHTATVVLAAAWSVRGGVLRSQALGCAKTLAKASPRLAMWLSDQALVVKDATMRRAAAPAVATALHRSGATLTRLARFYLRDKSPVVRAAVLQEIAKRPPKSPAFLWRFVKPLTNDEDGSVRAASAPLVMTCSRSKQGARTLVALLDDRDRRVSTAAVAAVGKLNANKLQGRDLFDAAMARVVARTGRQRALEALRVAKKLGLTKPLVRAATHPEADVRAVAVEALSRHGEPKATARALAAAQRDREPALRKAAIRAIARESKRLGKTAVSLLERSITATDPADRWAAFEALGRIQGEAANDAVVLLAAQAKHRSEGRRRMAIRALGRLLIRARSRRLAARREAAKALQVGTQDPALDVREEARAALATFWGRTRSPEALWKLLLSSVQDGVTRRTAVAALAWHARERNVDWLAKRVKSIDKLDPTLRIAARLALRLGRGHASPSAVLSDLFGR